MSVLQISSFMRRTTNGGNPFSGRQRDFLVFFPRVFFFFSIDYFVKRLLFFFFFFASV